MREYLSTIKLTTDKGDSWVTEYNSVNVTREEIASYYMGSKFNLGIDGDVLETVTKIEFLD